MRETLASGFVNVLSHTSMRTVVSGGMPTKKVTHSLRPVLMGIGLGIDGSGSTFKSPSSRVSMVT